MTSESVLTIGSEIPLDVWAAPTRIVQFLNVQSPRIAELLFPGEPERFESFRFNHLCLLTRRWESAQFWRLLLSNVVQFLIPNLLQSIEYWDQSEVSSYVAGEVSNDQTSGQVSSAISSALSSYDSSSQVDNKIVTALLVFYTRAETDQAIADTVSKGVDLLTQSTLAQHRARQFPKKYIMVRNLLRDCRSHRKATSQTINKDDVAFRNALKLAANKNLTLVYDEAHTLFSSPLLCTTLFKSTEDYRPRVLLFSASGDASTASKLNVAIIEEHRPVSNNSK